MSLLIKLRPLQHLPAALPFPLFFFQFIGFTQDDLPQWFGGFIQICRNFSRAQQWSGQDWRIFAQESAN